MLYTKIFLCFFVYFNIHVYATNDELMQEYVRIFMECTKDFPLTEEDIEKLKNKQLPDNENISCLFACAYKSSGMMDDKGMLSVEGVNNRAQDYLADDAERLAKARDFTDACKYVNDVEVSDGARGCERAALIFKCSVDKASQFGFGT